MAKYIGYVGVIITLLGFLIGGVTKFNSITAQAETTKAKVEEVKVKVEKLEDEGDKEIKDLKTKDAEFDKQIEVAKSQQENIKKEVEEMNKKVDKVIELLLDMKQKKK